MPNGHFSSMLKKPATAKTNVANTESEGANVDIDGMAE